MPCAEASRLTSTERLLVRTAQACGSESTARDSCRLVVRLGPVPYHEQVRCDADGRQPSAALLTRRTLATSMLAQSRRHHCFTRHFFTRHSFDRHFFTHATLRSPLLHSPLLHSPLFRSPLLHSLLFAPHFFTRAVGGDTVALLAPGAAEHDCRGLWRLTPFTRGQSVLGFRLFRV